MLDTLSGGSGRSSRHDRTFARVELSLPSGLAGNLFVTALIRIGLPWHVVAEIPGVLGLEHFSLTWRPIGADGGGEAHRVLDGVGGRGSGSVEEMIERMDRLECGRWLAKKLVRRRYAAKPAKYLPAAEWADTAFDCAAAAVGLVTLGTPSVTVVDPLPRSHKRHPVAESLLEGWLYRDVESDLELITPTAAAILSVVATQRSGGIREAGPRAEVLGRFAAAEHLAPLVIAAGFERKVAPRA